MKCFNHPQADAVGICCNCGKGLCAACATKSASGKISCSENCSTALSGVEQTVRMNLAWGPKTWRVLAGFLWVVSLILGGFAVFLAVEQVWPLVALLAAIVVVFVILGFVLKRFGKGFDSKAGTSG